MLIFRKPLCNYGSFFDLSYPWQANGHSYGVRKEGALREEEIAELLKKENEEFKKLTEEHKTLEELLSKIDSKRYLTPEEEVERKKIQKQKLLKKDRMATLVREYKRGHAN